MIYLFRKSTPSALLVLFFLSLFSVPVFARVCTPDFLDGLFKGQIKQHSIAGLSFSLYSGDTITLTRSWGYSHVEEGRFADENTGFSIGSVSKLFIWVSAMQLVEQGKLSMERPVNEYLKGFRLPDSYKPVTMKHLMTHTSGFEDHLHLFAKSTDRLPELETYLIENLPAQIFEPGTTPAYSNYGSVLAAYVIEQVTGMDFNDYVEKNVFDPLQMKNTTFRQPASFSISEARSKGYMHRDGRFVSPFDEFVLPAPAGSAVSTSADMVKFMAAMLNKPLAGQDNILSEASISRILSLLYTPNDHADGMGYGIFRMNYFGKEVFWHGGNTFFFQTVFVLVPSMRTGFFFSANTASEDYNYIDPSLLIIDYLNGNKRELNAIRRVNGMNHYSGIYKSTRRIESSYLKVFTPFMYSRVVAAPEGLLMKDITGREYLYRPYEEDVFASSHKKLIFERDEKGNIFRLVLSDLPIFVYEKIGWRENPALNIIILLLVLLIALRNIVIPVWRSLKGDKRSRQYYRWLLLLSGIFLYLFFVLFFNVYGGMENVVFEKPSSIKLIMLIPMASLLLFAGAIIFWFQGAIWSRQPISATFFQFAGFVIMVLFYLQMNFWNLFSLS